MVNHRNRLRIRNGERSVDRIDIVDQVVGDSTLSNTYLTKWISFTSSKAERNRPTLRDTSTLSHQRLAIDPALQRTPRRIGEPTLNLSSTLFLEITRHSSQRSSRSRSADERLQSTGERGGLFVDFRTGRFDVRLTISCCVAFDTVIRSV